MHQKGLTKMSKIKNNVFKPCKSLAAIAVSAAIMLASPAVWAASDVHGQARGTIVSSGVDLANVTVVLKHESKGFTRKVTTNSIGEFTLKGLPVGTYTATISKAGYQTAEVKGLAITIGQTSNLGDISLSDSSIEVIEIRGNAVAKIDLESSQQGVVFNTAELALLPIGEDLSSVAVLAPGNSMGAGGIFDGIDGSDGRLVSSAGGLLRKTVII
jgi:hypothetical protein